MRAFSLRSTFQTTLFGILSLFCIGVVADPLAETREIIFTGSEGSVIADKAAELQSPAKIYEYVRNTHEYALYHGSRQNTINTFLGQRGSDVDIASVLIAMYRSQNIPARYVKGTVRLTEAELINWIGVEDVTLAKAIMRDQGIQGVSPYPTNNGQFVEFEHVWVQVQIPYDDYRGANQSSIDCTATPNRCSWIDVDPSFKLREYHNQNIDIYNLVPFDYDRYYNAILNDDADYRDKNPLEIYEEQILDYLAINFPGRTLEDVADPGVIIPVDDGILPASLPFEVIGAVTTYNSVEDHDTANDPDWAKFLVIRYNLGAFTFTGGVVGPFILSSSSDPIALADLSTKRITLSYFEGNQIPSDPFEHHQMTVRLDGQIIDTPILIAWQNDQADYLGRIFDVTFELDGAPGIDGGADNVIEATYPNLVFGGYYVIGTGGDTSNWSQVHRAADQLLQANEQFPIINDGGGVPYVDANDNGSIDAGEIRLLDDPIAQDNLTGGLLQVSMTQYYTQFVEQSRRLDALNQVISPIEGFVGIVSSTYDVEYLDSTAFSVMPGGLLIDMKGVQFNGNWRINVPDTYANDHFELMGHLGSSLEHEIWQQITGFDAVSTVRGIQMALANGAALQRPENTGSSNNMASQFPAFRFDDNPSGFTYTPFTVFGTNPATWTHASNGAEMEVLKRNVTTADTSLDRALVTYQYSTSGGLYGWVNCVDGFENQLLGFPPTATINPFTFCDGTVYSGQVSTILSQIQNNYLTNIIPNIIGQSFFDFFDQAQGFNRLEHVYRPLALAIDEHSGSRIQDIRDDVALGDDATVGGQPGRWEYVIPSRKTDTGFNQFTVFLEKIFSQVDGSLASQSYSISNDSFTAGGGWVDGSETLDVASAIPGTSIIQPTFNNEIFTDALVVSQANNDLVKTPSTADPISTVTGNMYHDETDLIIKSRGLSYVFTRSYNSAPARSGQNGPLGFGWTHSYNMSLRSNDYGDCPNCAAGTGAGQAPENGNNVTASITYIDERAGEHTYLVNETTQAITPPPGEFDSLQINTPSSGLHTIEFRNGTRYVFEGPSNLNTVSGQTARLSYIEDPYNNRLTLSYDGSGRLSNVVDNLGVAGRTGITFNYSGASTLIQSISDWSGRTWQFGYNNDRLTSITNPLSDITTYVYHGDTNLLTEMVLPQDRSGQQAKNVFTYYRNNKAFTQKNALEQGETVDYDLYRQRTQIADARGFLRNHSYDTDNGALIKLEEPDGAILRFENNADGLRYSKRDGLGFLTQYSYQSDRSISANASNNNGLVSREIDPLGNNTDINYGIHDQPTTTTDKRGNPLTRTYYASTNSATGAVAGKLQEVRTTLNGTPNILLESYTYYADSAQNNFGQLQQRIEYIDPAQPTRQRITNYSYDASGINLTNQTVIGNTSGGAIITTFTYDTLGRLETQTLQRRTSATDATIINLTTTFEYDALNRVIRTTDPRGDIAETVYDDNGKVSEERVRYFTSTPRANCAAPSGGYVVCTYVTNTYDAADRLVSTTDILGNTASFEYDASGNLIKQTDANGHSTRFEYDGLNRRSAEIDANGFRTEFEYDLAGRMISTTDPDGTKTQFEYDALGRQTKVISPLGIETEFQYDANGNRTHLIDANALASGTHPRNSQGASEFREYDELNRLTRVLDALNGETLYTYDLLGNITSYTDAEGQVTQLIHDDLGRLIETIDPIIETPTDLTDRVTLYDQAGNALLVESRSGRTQQHTFDNLNRLVQSEYLFDSTQDTFFYDDFGDLTQIANNGVTYTYTYTPRHELQSKTDSRQNRSLNWTFDPVGNVLTKTDYQTELTTFQYDSTNRLVAMSNPGYLQVSYHYDPAGRLLNRILSNKAQTNYQYDADGRLIQLENVSANNTVVQSLNYQYDPMGNITQVAESGGRTVDYTYDALHRLTNADSTNNVEDRTYTYDAVGNRQTEDRNGTVYYYTYNPSGFGNAPVGNRLLNIRTGSGAGPLYRQFIYDDSGRITQKQDGSGSPIYTVTYDGKGRASLIDATQFEYDPNDFRIQKASDLYYLEGEHFEATYTSTGDLQDKYFRGVLIDEIVNSFHYNSSDPNDWINYTFHHDHINSVTALTGHAGSTEQTWTYDPFGQVINTQIPGTGNELLFTGRNYDPETGLYYYRSRYMDPEIGRFITEDNLGISGGINLYAYVNNNPINAADPSGNIPLDTIADIAFIAADIGIIIKDGPTLTNVAALGLDVVGALVPYATGFGSLARGADVATDIATQGRVGEELVSAAIDVPRNIGPGRVTTPGTGPGGFRIPDFDPNITVQTRGTVVEVKNVTNPLSDTPQLRDLQNTANNDFGVPLEIFTNSPPGPNSRLTGQADLGNIIFSPIPQQTAQTTTRTNGLGFAINVADQANQAFGGGGDILNPGAGGGFVLYPNRPNLNTSGSVYSK